MTDSSVANKVPKSDASDDWIDSSAAAAQPATSTQGNGTLIADAFPSAESLTTINDVLASPASVTAAELTLSWWPNVRGVEQLLLYLSENTGAPWWAIIVGCTIAVRVAILPVVIKGQANAARLANIQDETKEIMADVTYHKQNGDMKSAQTSIQRVHGLWQQHKCHPSKALLLPLTQMPLFVTFFFAIRAMAQQGLDTMKIGGYNWFLDLTAPDPLLIGPILTAVTALASFETGAEFGRANSGADPSTGKNVKMGMRALVCAMPLFVYKFPAGIFLYWITNNLFSLCQMLVLQIPAVRDHFDIPSKKDAGTPPTSATGGFVKSLTGGSHGKLGRPMTFAESVRAGFESQAELQASKRGESLLTPSDQAESTGAAVRPGRRQAYEKWMKSGNAEATATTATPREVSGKADGPSKGLFEAEGRSSVSRGSISTSPTDTAQSEGLSGAPFIPANSHLLHRENQEAEKRRRVLQARERRQSKRRF